MSRIVPVALIIALGTTTAAQIQGVSRFLLAEVADMAGEPMIGLLPDDFIVEESGSRRQVLDVRAAEYPLLLMLDTSGDAFQDILHMRTAARDFVRQTTLRPIGVLTYGDTPSMLIDFTDDAEKVADKLDGLFARPETPSYLFDCLVRAGGDVRKLESPMSLVVVLSAGALDQSRRTPAEVLRPLLRSGSVIHMIDRRSIRAGGRLSNPRLRRNFVGLASQAAMEQEAVLRGIAAETGGDYELVYSSTGYAEALTSLAKRLEGQFQVEYGVPSRSAASNDLRIGVRMPGAKVTGRGLPGPLLPRPRGGAPDASPAR